MPELVVITGPPGAGKSTVAKLLAHTFDRSILVKGDDFFGSLAAGTILPWLPGSEVQNLVVQKAAAAATGHFVRGGYDTVYEGVLGPWHVDDFLTAGDIESMHYAVLLPAVDVCVCRVTTRKGHGFKDLNATRRVHADFLAADIDPRHVMSEPPAEIDKVVELISERVNDGSLIRRRAVAS